jgi:two-component system, cell cycle sensor histidine kinase and response regulator CckA
MLFESLSRIQGALRRASLHTPLPVEDREVMDSPLQIDMATFRLLFEFNPQPMWIHDLETRRFLAVNSAATRNYLYSRDKFASMTIDQLCLPGESSASRKQRKAEPSDTSPLRIQRHRRSDGTVFVAGIASSDVVFNGCKAKLVLATNVAGRERAEKMLQETRERYRDLFDHANDIVFTTDLNGRLTSLNRAGEMATGYSLEEAANANVSKVLCPYSLELARNMREKTIIDGEQTTYEVEIVRKDGRTATFVVSTWLMYHNGKACGIQGTARDVTERKQLEDRLRQSQKTEALGLLAGGIAHDFNNLLSVMIGYGEMLTDRLKSEDPLRRYAVEVLKAGQQASTLTGQLLAFSRRQVLQPRVFNLNTTIANMEQLLRRLILEQAEITFKPDPQLGQVKADAGQLEQVIMNLAVNARDAMPQGGELHIETANVEVQQNDTRHDDFVAPGRYVLLTVSDTGIGMSAKTMANIFEPFFTTKGPGKGTGLGLATVYGIVKQSGGFLSVKSQEGKGSSFMIYLPRVEEPPSDFTCDASPIVKTAGLETVLLVDDAEPFRKLVRIVLEEAGYSVIEARTSSEAAQAGTLHDGPIHLLLTDVIMPKVDGYQLSDYLKFHRPDMKVLYMSGYTGSTAGQSAVKSGTRLLPKPLRKDALLSSVRQVLDEPEEQEDLLLSLNLPGGADKLSCD